MEEMAKLGVTEVWVSNRVAGPRAWADEVCAQTVTRFAELG